MEQLEKLYQEEIKECNKALRFSKMMNFDEKDFWENKRRKYYKKLDKLKCEI
jgi:hypothetical protein